MAQNKKVHQEILQDNGGLFKKFEWMKDEFDLPK